MHVVTIAPCSKHSLAWAVLACSDSHCSKNRQQNALHGFVASFSEMVQRMPTEDNERHDQNQRGKEWQEVALGGNGWHCLVPVAVGRGVCRRGDATHLRCTRPRRMTGVRALLEPDADDLARAIADDQA